MYVYFDQEKVARQSEATWCEILRHTSHELNRLRTVTRYYDYLISLRICDVEQGFI